MANELIGVPDWDCFSPNRLLTDGEGGCLIVDVGNLPVIDSATMSARARICTSRKDRDGDVIEPSGVTWDDYRFNPIVRYEHGFSGIPWPIARSDDQSGTLHVQYDEEEDAIYARSFFSESHELSEQCFRLIEDRFLRATSIYVFPVEGGFTKYGDGSHWVQNSTMFEYSWCSVGKNPDAFMKAVGNQEIFSELVGLQLEAASRILDRGTLNDRPILPALAKCLRMVLPPKQAIGKGFEGTMTKKTLTDAEVRSLKPVALAKALANQTEFDASTVQLLAGYAKSLDDAQFSEACKPKADVATDATDTSSMDGSMTGDDLGAAPDVSADQTPMGATVISNFHSDLTNVLSGVEAALKQCENPAVKEGLQPIIDDIRSQMTAVEGVFSSCYPDQSPLTSEAAPEDMGMAKAWLSKPRSRYQLEGLAARLGSVSVSDGKAKALIAGTVRDLRLLAGQAKSFKPEPPKDMVSKAEYDRVCGMLKKLTDGLKKIPAPVGA